MNKRIVSLLRVIKVPINRMIQGVLKKHWSVGAVFIYFIIAISRKLGYPSSSLVNLCNKIAVRHFIKWLQVAAKKMLKDIKKKGLDIDTTGLEYAIANPVKWQTDVNTNGRYLDFKGAIIHENDIEMVFIYFIFPDSFFMHYFFNDNYDKKILDYIDPMKNEGPYGYKDGDFDVSVKEGDVVIDAGAFIGDFSAYAAAKGCVVYAFEPIKSNYDKLCRTAALNSGTIIPVNLGVSDKNAELFSFALDASSSFIVDRKGAKDEKIQLVTIDEYVEKNNITKIDFIKADIEGSERGMLLGATKVLKEFAPKLAICTYHLPDDREVIKKIILEANPNYTIVQCLNKLFAVVDLN